MSDLAHPGWLPTVASCDESFASADCMPLTKQVCTSCHDALSTSAGWTARALSQHIDRPNGVCRHLWLQHSVPLGYKIVVALFGLGRLPLLFTLLKAA